MGEFAIIRDYFEHIAIPSDTISLGIGDDAAIVSVPNQQRVAITTDTLIEGVHFPQNTSAFDVGFKSLAVNLSDLAAMGATPAWFTLSLSMPAYHDEWLRAFTQGLSTLANQHTISLIGGDLTRGPLSITIQAMGLLPQQHALLRSGAKPGDAIYVSGYLGDAAYALQLLKQSSQASIAKTLLNKLNQPQPRIALGNALLPIAHAAIDISDGLAADLGHILDASHVGATLCVEDIPLSPELQQSENKMLAYEFALNGGDDYELCFTISKEEEHTLTNIRSALNLPITKIGFITEHPGLTLTHSDGRPYHGNAHGYEHF